MQEIGLYGFCIVSQELELEHIGKRTKMKLARKRWYGPEDKLVRG